MTDDILDPQQRSATYIWRAYLDYAAKIANETQVNLHEKSFYAGALAIVERLGDIEYYRSMYLIKDPRMAAEFLATARLMIVDIGELKGIIKELMKSREIVK